MNQLYTWQTTYFWKSFGKSKAHDFLSCLMDMCFLDRFEWLCKALIREPVEIPRPCTKLSRRIQLSIFELLDPCMYLWAESPLWRRSCRILSTMVPFLLESCLMPRRLCVQNQEDFLTKECEMRQTNRRGFNEVFLDI